MPDGILNALGGLRSKDTCHLYARLLDIMIQAVVSYKNYKANRLTKPLCEWVTISDEAFLLLCLDNYGLMWLHEATPEQHRSIEEGEKKPSARWTGRDKGTRKSWSQKSIKVFNDTMEKVYYDRERRGKEFDEFFLGAMQQRYGKKPNGGYWRRQRIWSGSTGTISCVQ